MTEWVHPEHQEIHEYLIHWGRWLRSSYPQGHCRSIEYRYKSPQCWYPLEPRPEPPEEQKALTVEKHVRNVQKAHRRLLKFKYVYRADREWISARLRFRGDRYETELYAARQAIKILTFPEVSAYSQIYNPRMPGHAENKLPSGSFHSKNSIGD